jgi:hypothetical protein
MTVTEEHMQIVEINGVKMEVDLRRARVVHENLKIGSAVKVLEKGGYGSPEVRQGVIVGFDLFPELPTITVAYIVTGYDGAELKFAAINAKTAEKFSMVSCHDDELPLHKDDLIASFDRKVTKLEGDIRDLQAKKAYFLRHFDQFFVTTEATA